MLRKGFKLPHYQNAFGVKSLDYAGIVKWLVRRKRYEDILKMLQTMRLTNQAFGNIMWKICEYAANQPCVFEKLIEVVVKPCAPMMQPFRGVRSVPITVCVRPVWEGVQACAYIDLMIRYFDYEHTDFKKCHPDDYTWMCARYTAFDASTPETFRALPPSLRKSIRLCLWATSRLPKDIRKRIARTLVLAVFAGDVDIGSVVADTHHQVVQTSERETLRMLMLQKRHAEVFGKMTGGLLNIERDNSLLAMLSHPTWNLGLLRLHQALEDESLLSIHTVMEWQRGLESLDQSQQDYIVQHLQKSRRQPICAYAQNLCKAPALFQRRLLYLELSKASEPRFFGDCVSPVVDDWIKGWRLGIWGCLNHANQFYMSVSFLQECKVALLSLNRVGITNKYIQESIIAQLSRLHGITHQQRFNPVGYRTKLQCFNAAKRLKLLSLEPCLSRQQLYATLPDVCPTVNVLGGDEPVLKRAKSKCKSCVACLLRKVSLCDMERALNKWFHFSILLRGR